MEIKLTSLSRAGLLALLFVGWMPLSGQTTPAAAPVTAPTDETKKEEDKVVKLETFEVKGLRGSLASSADIKRSKLEVVDSIVASDIDKLPDINASYALSRVPGVQLAHTFSGLGGNGAVTIRGLNQITNTIDGRQVITPGGIANGTAGVGVGQRNFDYSQIPASLIAGIDVYKTAAANQLDGGLGGLVDVRMRKPFDFATGYGGGVTVGTTYSELADEGEMSYNIFANASVMTKNGKFGVLIAYSDITTPWREDAIGIGNPVVNATVVTGDATVLSSTGYNVSASFGEFKTDGLNLVVQWQPNKNWEFYAGYNPNRWRNVQDTAQFTTALSAANSVPGSGVLFEGSSTAVRAASFANLTGTAYGLIRDLENKLEMFNGGGHYINGALLVKFDANHYTSSNRFQNNLVFASVAIPSLRYDLAGEIPSVAIGGVGLQDPSVYRLSQVNYRLFPSNTEGNAARIDGEYNFAKSFISKLVGGVRYATTTSDNYDTGLFLGSYTIPSSANTLNLFPGLWGPSPVQDFFTPYSQPQIPSFLAGKTDIMRDANAFYKAYGATNTPDTSATVNKLSLFDIEETTTALYLMPKFSTAISGHALEGNIGLRAVQTKNDLSGYKGATSATSVPITITSSYWDYLPSFNGRIQMTEGLYFRAAASKTMSRPNFGSMSPSLTLNANPVNPNLNSGSQGNPDLQPIRAVNYDLGLEYYFNKHDLVYVAGFYKDVEGFIASISEQQVHDGVTYLISTSRNLNPAKIKGVEVGFQSFFTYLPAPWDGFGLQANYTYVDSETSSVQAGVGRVTTPLTNLSEHSYNIIAMYEKGPFAARVAYNYRSTFITGFAYFVDTGLLNQQMEGYADLDASLNYQITKNVSLAVQGVNLTNTLRYQDYGSKMVPSNIFTDGRQFLATVTLRY
jgi:iron complex outermembrane receptor protein